jgi:hypothetical protein
MSADRIVSSRFPYVPMHLRVNRRIVEVEELLDTGFDGDVALPPALIAGDRAPDGYVRLALADGSRIFAPYYIGALRLGPMGPFPAVVTALGDEPLVGQGIAAHVTIILDHGARVIVEP